MVSTIDIKPVHNVTIKSGVNAPVANSGGEMDALLLGRTRELVAASPGRRNWRGIFIALLVIAAVLGLIVFSIFLLSPEDEGIRIRGRRITLSDIIGNGLKWTPFNGTWLNDGELVFRDPTGGLSILSLNNLSYRVLMTNSTFRQLNAEKFIVSPDINFVLLLSESNADGAKYHVYEINTRNTYPLSHSDVVREASRLQHVLWAPNSVRNRTDMEKGKATSQAIAFIYQNDVYYKPQIQNDLVCRLTNTGQSEVIYNGIPDWLYGTTEELRGDTLTFSPDGVYLSFLSFNDSQVQKYEYTKIGDNLKYPELKSTRYPKAETTNPRVTVQVANLSIWKYINAQPIKIPSTIDNDSYVSGMQWISNTDLSVTLTNRWQTKAITILCRAPAFNCIEVYTEQAIDDGFVLLNDKPLFSRFDHYNFQDGTKDNNANNKANTNRVMSENEFQKGGFMLKRLPVRDGEHGYYRHVVFVSTSDLRQIPLTMGRYETTEIIGWDEPKETVYFMATPLLTPGQRHLYRLHLKLNNTHNTNRIYVTSTEPECLTCNNQPNSYQLQSMYYDNDIDKDSTNTTDPTVPDKIPNNCAYNKIYFSKSYSYYVQECLGPDSPSVYLVETSTNLKRLVLNDGNLLRNRLNQLALPQIRTFNVEIRHGFQAHVRLFLPPGMKEEEEIAFPLILEVDASPGSQLVSEMYKVDWNWYLCSYRSMLVAQIDARGSGYQGEMMRSQIKYKIGTVEIEDQLGVLTYLRDSMKFVDPTRICVYGRGYGGYASTQILADDTQRILQCAAAINPITSFVYQTSFFTERYFPRGEEYNRIITESDLISKAENIGTRNYMIIHSTGDTVVHPQNSLRFGRSLIEHGICFKQQVYADEDHEIKTNLVHLYKTLEWFFDDSFGPLELNEWDPSGFFGFKQ